MRYPGILHRTYKPDLQHTLTSLKELASTWFVSIMRRICGPSFPFDEEGLPMIPDIIEVEKAIEWYIKKEILLNL